MVGRLHTDFYLMGEQMVNSFIAHKVYLININFDSQFYLNFRCFSREFYFVSGILIDFYSHLMVCNQFQLFQQVQKGIHYLHNYQMICKYFMAYNHFTISKNFQHFEQVVSTIHNCYFHNHLKVCTLFEHLNQTNYYHYQVCNQFQLFSLMASLIYNFHNHLKFEQVVWNYYYHIQACNQFQLFLLITVHSYYCFHNHLMACIEYQLF